MQRASEIYNTERRQVKNYRVVQNIVSEIKGPTGTTIEKRNQIGFFKSPNQFVFIIKEKTINGKIVKLDQNNTEKSQKNDLNWLAESSVFQYHFEEIGTNGNIIKFRVRPKAKMAEAYEGEIWLHSKTAKLIRMIKEPVNKEKGIQRYRTEVFFESDLPFQEPSYTKLNAVFEGQDGAKMEARVEAIFTNYLFNFDMKDWKE